MILTFLNLIVSIIIAAYLGFNAYHNGFFVPQQPLVGESRHFNFLSPMLWFIVLDFIFIILLAITYSKLSDKTKKILSILAPIWTIITILVCLGAYLYN